MSDNIEDKIAAQAKQDYIEDKVGHMAAVEPLPGATKAALGLTREIRVGRVSVRPFYDIDFELLSQLNHPLHGMMLSDMEGKGGDHKIISRGPAMWQLAWMMTNTVDAAEEAVADGTLAAKAKASFKLYQFKDMEDVVMACLKQIRVYWSSAIAYGDEEAAKATAHPESLEAPSTGSVGS